MRFFTPLLAPGLYNMYRVPFLPVLQKKVMLVDYRFVKHLERE